MAMMLIDQTKDTACKTAEADAIRAKTGDSASLAYDWANNKGFADAIEAIPSGIDPVEAIFTKSFSLGDIEIHAPQGMFTYVLPGRTGSCRIHDYTSPSVGDSAFTSNTGLTWLRADAVENGSPNSFMGCTSLQYLIFPRLVLHYTYWCSNCSSLIGVDYGGSPTSSQGFIRTNGYNGCTKFKYMVLRGSTVWALSNIGNFSNTPFDSGKAGGTLYVPQNLIASYQAATNWSTILGYPNNQIKSIESTATDPDAPVDLTTHYIDGSLID